MVGIWMWPESVVKHGAERAVGVCAQAGVTDIFFLSKGLSGRASFSSPLALACAERDLLGETIAEAHKLGIRVHAWFTSAADAVYKQQHPESGLYHFVNGANRGIVSISNADYTAYLKNLITDLISRYPIDGLHLDYLRYNHLIYGWSEDDIRRYKAAGVDAEHVKKLVARTFLGDAPEKECIFDAYRNGDTDVLRLAEARRKDVNRFAKELIGAARFARKGLIVSAALMPEGAYSDLAFSDLHYGQHYSDFRGLLDYALPMSYSVAYEKDAAWVNSVAQGTIAYGLKPVAGLHAYAGGTGEQLKADIESLRNTPVEGICLFREGAMSVAVCDEKKIRVFNPTDTDITQIGVAQADQYVVLNKCIPAGEDAEVTAPFAADTVRVFSGEQETCVYTTQP